MRFIGGLDAQFYVRYFHWLESRLKTEELDICIVQEMN